jgi:hypothetical protein
MVPYSGRRGDACPTVPVLRLCRPRSCLIVTGRRGSTRTTQALVVCGPGMPGQPRVGYPVPADAAAHGINAAIVATSRRQDFKTSWLGVCKSPAGSSFFYVWPQKSPGRVPGHFVHRVTSAIE